MRNSILVWVVAPFLGAACTGDIFESGGGEAPSLLAVSANETSVGQSLQFVGQNFLTGADGRTKIDLEGTFTSTDGAQNPVDMTVNPHWREASVLLWANVGPFSVPFSADGGDMGTFEGRATPINLDPQLRESPGESMPMTLTVGPSIVVRDLQPLLASCPAPATRLLGGFPYRIEVEAIGFQPVSFSFRFINQDNDHLYRVKAEGNIGMIGDGGEIVLDQVPTSVHSYLTELEIVATDADGKTLSTIFAFGVHRPVEALRDGISEIVQIESPEPTSGCIAGGLNGQHTDYSETTADTRSRQKSFHFDTTWTNEHSSQYSTSHEERNGMSMSTTEMTSIDNETNYQHSGTNGGGANVGIFGAVQGGLSYETSHTDADGGSYRESRSTGFTVGHDYSEADTESWAFTNSESLSQAEGTGSFWEVSSTDTVNRGFAGDVIPGMYGVWYRQVTRIRYPGRLIAYNLCGDPETIADAYIDDFVWATALAQGTECNPLPKSTLPEAQCLISPCN